ncbi:craniofacial development protein 2 [Biomphalaria glabrata]|nr:craniofacial development protein 2 [Biomphalaria glabrata]
MSNHPRAKKRLPLKNACSNVLTMQANDVNSCLQWNSALVAFELSQLGVNISAHSELHLAGQGSFTERGAGYTFYCSERVP